MFLSLNSSVAGLGLLLDITYFFNQNYFWKKIDFDAAYNIYMYIYII